MKTAKSPENLSIGERISIIRSQFCGNDNKKLAQLAGIDQSSTSKIIIGTLWNSSSDKADQYAIVRVPSTPQSALTQSAFFTQLCRDNRQFKTTPYSVLFRLHLTHLRHVVIDAGCRYLHREQVVGANFRANYADICEDS